MDKTPSDNPEIRGLEVIASNSQNLHSIKEPPIRNDFKSDEQFRKAYYEWERDLLFWKASVAPRR